MKNFCEIFSAPTSGPEEFTTKILHPHPPPAARPNSTGGTAEVHYAQNPSLPAQAQNTDILMPDLHDRRDPRKGAPDGSKAARGQLIGRTKGGLNSKLHVLANAKGRPFRISCQQAKPRITSARGLWTYNNDRPNMGIGGIIPAQKLKMVA